MSEMKFTTIADAKRQTGLSYLGSINSSAKIIKNKKVSNNYTYIIYLAPASQSGYNVCPNSTPECRMGCLNTSGRAGIDIASKRDIIKNARIKKTKLFFEHQEFFMQWAMAEMRMFQAKAKRDGYEFSARLNGTSDIDWSKIEVEGKTILKHFPSVQFYDYTKDGHRFGRIPANYQLTYSYTGNNLATTLDLLTLGFNVAVVFDTKKGKALPATFNGYPVIDGDLTDYRPNDGDGVVVGLRFKKIANKVAQAFVLNSQFVVKG